jgi:WD40 repeat protein
LIAERIVLLYSPSGAGKTSLLQASLIPALQAEGFRVLPVMRVNASLLGEAAQSHANRYSLSCILSLEEGLPEAQQTPLAELAGLSLGDYLDRYADLPGNGAPWHGDVLVFDQFEEVLTLDPADRTGKLAYFEQVGQALRNRSRWAVFSMREEFIAGLDPYLKPIPTRFDKSRRFRLELLGPDAAAQAMQRPARQAGVDFTDAAAARLVRDLGSIRVQQPDGSTLLAPGDTVEPVQLQVVCWRLWERLAPEDAVIDVDDIEAMGDVDTALRSYYADTVAAVAASAGVQERAIRDWVESHLITGQDIRGQVLQGVDASEGLPNAAIWRLVDAHLLRAEQRRGATWFELAHDRLVGPVREDNAAWREATLSPLQRQALAWQHQGKPVDSHLLLARRALVDAQRWATAHPSQVSALDQEFLAASHRVQRQQDMRRRLIALAAIAATLLLVVTAVSVKLLLDNNATRQENRARTVAAQARNLQFTQPDLSLLLSAEALAIVPRQNNEIDAALLAVLDDNPQLDRVLRASDHAIKALAVDAERRLLAAGDDTGQVFVWDLNQERQTAVSPLRAAAAITDLAFAPGSSLLAAADKSGVVTLWDLSGQLGLQERAYDSAAAELLRQTATPPPPPPPQNTIPAHTGQVNALAWSPDGARLATVGKTEALLWQVDDLALVDRTPVDSGMAPWSVAFSPDGTSLAVGNGDGSIILQDLFLGASETLQGELGRVRTLAFSPDGRLLASGVNTPGVDHAIGLVQIWDLQANMAVQMAVQRLAEVRQTLRSHSDAVESVAFSSDGQILASAGRDSTIHLWNVADGVPEGEPLRGHLGWVNDLAFEPGSSSLFSAGASGEVNHWLVGRRTRLGQPLSGHGDQVWAVSFSPDSARLASGSKDSSVRIWDVASQDGISLDDHDQPVSAVAWSPDGQLLASGSQDASVILWDAASGAARGRLAGRNWITALAVDPNDSGLLASADADNQVLLWDLSTTPAVSTTLTETLPTRVAALAFDRRGEMLYGGDAAGRIYQWNVAQRRLNNVLVQQSKLPIASLAIDPTGRLLAAASYGRQLTADSYDNALYLWRLPSLRPLGSGVLVGHTRPASSVAFHPDGQLLASASQDGSIILWDVETQQQIGSPLRGHGAPVNAVAFSPDGRWLASGGDDNTVILWPMTPDAWVDIACRIVGRSLTAAEVEQYLAGRPVRACVIE